MKPIRERSGSIGSNDKFVVFVYLLGRDHLSLGEIERIMGSVTQDKFMFSNGWLAQYAKDVVDRLRSK